LVDKNFLEVVQFLFNISNLIVVMLGNNAFDGDSGGHGPLLATDQSTSGPEGKTCKVPDGQKGGGPNSVLRHHRFEGREVVLLLVPHVLD
jgi:hypothetical protein